MYNELDIDSRIIELVEKIESSSEVKELFSKVSDNEYKNTLKVLSAFHKYEVGDEVFLSKGTFIHGIFGELDNFGFTVENGFIAVDFTEEPRSNKICNSVGMWNIKEDMLLKEYINQICFEK